MTAPRMPDVRLLATETVVVTRPSDARDDLGEPVGGEPGREAVDGVLVAPGASADLDASRPHGTSVTFTLCFPRGYDKGLKGCSVEVRGTPCRVVGDPQGNTRGNVPVPWNLTVEVTRTDG